MTWEPSRSTGRLRASRPRPLAPALTVTMAAGLLASLAACDGDNPPDVAASTAASAASRTPPAVSPTPSIAPTTPIAPVGNVVTLDCYLDDDFSSSTEITIGLDASGKPDFSQAWADKLRNCDVATAGSGGTEVVVPASPVERAAYEASGYDENDIGTLFVICAEVDPEDTYAEPGFSMSASQIAEMSGAMKLCPKHPYTKKWQAAMRRGKDDAKLEAEGRLFGDGTYRVGKDIKPGTYATRDVDGCYWERQNRNGDIIDNNFISAAKRAQVTVRKSDYGFHTERCGTWRPA